MTWKMHDVLMTWWRSSSTMRLAASDSLRAIAANVMQFAGSVNMVFIVTAVALKATIATVEAKYYQCKILFTISCSIESDHGGSVRFFVLSALVMLQTLPATAHAHARRDALARRAPSTIHMRRIDAHGAPWSTSTSNSQQNEYRHLLRRCRFGLRLRRCSRSHCMHPTRRSPGELSTIWSVGLPGLRCRFLCFCC